MARTGVDNPWRPEDEPEPLEDWVKAGVPRHEAETWRNWRYRISEAMAWRNAGVFDGLQAAQWSTARVTASEVNQWQAAGIGATEAVSWHEFGFGLEYAKRQKARGVTPTQAYEQQQSVVRLGARGVASSARLRRGRRGVHPTDPMEKFMEAVQAGPMTPNGLIESYLLRQWFDEVAISWAKEGIDAAEAQLWRELGLKPAEAVRLTRQGVTVFQTVRDWWRAGIPIDEVADWIGAGLKPEEAADQRARGITAEQAATLRALRDDPGEQ